MLELGFIISAFVAGLLMFLAPCTLPLVPAYLAFISGASLGDLQNRSEAQRLKIKIFLNGLFFVLGFSIIFILFGTLAGLLGTQLAPVQTWLGRIGGAFVVLFGLFMLGVIKLPGLQKDRRMKLPTFLRIGTAPSSFAIGTAFAFGWTPCIGPILASILLLASTNATALQGAFLLAIFSLGLAVPFLMVAAFIAQAGNVINRTLPYLKFVSIIGGVFLVILGLLLLTDNFGLTIYYGYQWFEFIDYDRLLDYL